MYARRKEKEAKMTTKRYTNDASHSRFYVFRHKTVDGVQTMEHAHNDGDPEHDFVWKNGFFTAELFDEVTADQVAFNAARVGRELKDGFTYCIGKVFVEVDGHFQIQVF
jgi:hypothetical protein